VSGVAPLARALDLVVAFDATGSMAPCLFDVRTNLSRLTRELFERLPAKGVSVRVGVIGVCH